MYRVRAATRRQLRALARMEADGYFDPFKGIIYVAEDLGPETWTVLFHEALHAFIAHDTELSRFLHARCKRFNSKVEHEFIAAAERDVGDIVRQIGAPGATEPSEQ